jgi:hypothetical protein
MLSSINPLGERARQNRFGATASWYLLGSLLGGLTAGTLWGYIGSLLPDGRWRAVGVIVAAIAGAAFDLMGVRPPSIHRQVDENWLGRYRGWVYGLGFGFQLGLGVVTIVTTASVYVAFVSITMIGSPPLGALVGAIFGLSRALILLKVARVRDPGALRAVMRRLQDGRNRATGVAVSAQVVAVLIFAVILL